MRLIETDLPDVKRIGLDVYPDARGFFTERYVESKFHAFGITDHFVQDNHSRSWPGVVRGMHFQHTAPQGKLVGVLRGRILDVAVDVRPHSPQFGQHVAVELEPNTELLWIPPGFAHGFCVLGHEPADVLYKVTAPFNPNGEAGIRYDVIDWPLANPILSARDQQLPTLAEARPQLNQWFPA